MTGYPGMDGIQKGSVLTFDALDFLERVAVAVDAATAISVKVRSCPARSESNTKAPFIISSIEATGGRQSFATTSTELAF
jgi:hypothetical protein